MNKKYNINVGDKGTFKPTGNVKTTPSDVENIFVNIESENASRIVLFFHGGLVSEVNGIATAEAMNRHIIESNAYPISFVWETGLGETIKERALGIFDTKIFKKVLKYVIKKSGSKLNLSLDAKGFEALSDEEIDAQLERDRPFSDYLEETQSRSSKAYLVSDDDSLLYELEAELEGDVAIDEEFQEVLRNIDLEHDFIDPEIVQVADDEGQKGLISTYKIVKSIAKVSFMVIKRFIKERDHGFYPTIIEEILRELYIARIGSSLWNAMKTKAGEMWLPNDRLKGNKIHAGTYFLKKLNEYANEKNLRIDLIGHSAGSVAICNLLKTIQDNYNNLSINKVIFMAPACRSDLFHKEIVKQQSRFKSFRMFTMTDEAESEDALVNKVPKIYPRSLLYFISGVLEEEGKGYDEYILGMHRFMINKRCLKESKKLRDVKEFLNDSNRVVFSPSKGNAIGLNSTAMDHSAFDEDVETINSIKYLISE